VRWQSAALKAACSPTSSEMGEEKIQAYVPPNKIFLP
jgi:hypothetical protein